MGISARNLFVVVSVGLLLVGFLAAMLVTRRPGTLVDDGPLRVGDRLPELEITGTDGMSTGLKAFTRESEIVLVILDPASATCTESLKGFGGPESRAEGQLLGLCDCELDAARRFRETQGLDFHIYRPINGSLAPLFPTAVFPTVIGAKRGGEIAVVWQGANDDFRYDRVRELIQASYGSD